LYWEESWWALQGVPCVRDRLEVRGGPIEVAAEERGFISPVVGGTVLFAGVALVLIGRRRARACEFLGASSSSRRALAAAPYTSLSA
jgi:hypothetical protein